MHLVLKFWLWGRFVAEKQTYVLNLMAGHLLNMTYNENGKWNVWELDHYTDRSSLGIHFWDLYWKMAYLKFEKCWYSNVRPWETVQIWGDCPWCAVATDALMLQMCWCTDDADASDALMLLMLLMCWCFWCADAADALMLLMRWCFWCCWCADAADALMLLMRWCCCCADATKVLMLLMHCCC